MILKFYPLIEDKEYQHHILAKPRNFNLFVLIRICFAAHQNIYTFTGANTAGKQQSDQLIKGN
jgi:hypothetical protein